MKMNSKNVWICKKCQTVNTNSAEICRCCREPNPNQELLKEGKEILYSNKRGYIKKDKWYCPNCGIANDSNYCPQCGAPFPIKLNKIKKGG